MAKRSTKIPDNESKKARFKRIVEPRVGKALKAIGLIGNCTGGEYEYTQKDVANITTALIDAVSKMGDKFAGKDGTDFGFSLD